LVRRGPRRARADEDAAALCSDYPNAGMFLLRLRRYPREVIRRLEEAVAADRSAGDRSYEGTHPGNLGTEYMRLGDAQRAFEFFEQALDIYREVSDVQGEGANLDNMGTGYLKLGIAERAAGFHREALSIYRETGTGAARARRCST
jgi:tetratricopeptide (TPR) repeat protein